MTLDQLANKTLCLECPTPAMKTTVGKYEGSEEQE
jgi:hypothetical protein